MPYPNYFPSYQPGYFSQPVPDQLAQLRQNQQMQGMQQTIPQPQIMQPQVPQPMETNGIIWVQGEAGAKAYLVTPGSTVALWDSENQTIYLKSVDMSGMPSMRIIDYTERGGTQGKTAPPSPQVDFTQFVTRDQLEDILAERLKRPAKASKPKEDVENG